MRGMGCSNLITTQALEVPRGLRDPRKGQRPGAPAAARCTARAVKPAAFARPLGCTVHRIGRRTWVTLEAGTSLQMPVGVPAFGR